MRQLQPGEGQNIAIQQMSRGELTTLPSLLPLLPLPVLPPLFSIGQTYLEARGQGHLDGTVYRDQPSEGQMETSQNAF